MSRARGCTVLQAYWREPVTWPTHKVGWDCNGLFGGFWAIVAKFGFRGWMNGTQLERTEESLVKVCQDYSHSPALGGGGL